MLTPRLRNAHRKTEHSQQNESNVQKNPAMIPVEDIKGLPRVLLIGDSISIGYTVPARDALRGEGECS